MRILIAEDDPITRASLLRQLRNWQHEVTATEDGEQAWEAIAAAEFDIIITDWEMPRLSGLELVKRVRAAPRSAYIYIILLTSRSDKADIVAGIETGADDFVSKPFDRDELRVRLLAGQRIVLLERTLSRKNAELLEANERVHSGLRAAARVQQSMLPRGNISTPLVRTAWKYVPTDELAGDAIGLHLIDDRFLIAYVLDVSGHGVPAALLSVSTMHALEPIPQETSLLRAVPGGDLGSVRHPADVARELNQRFRAGEYDGRYLTMILCVLDTQTGRLHLTSAGHPSPLLIRRGQAIELPDAGGFPIAIMEVAEYEESCTPLEPGDRVYLYSDGVLEQPKALSDEQFGQTRLYDALAARTASAPEQVVAQLIDDLSEWAGGASFVDDVSIVAIEWMPR